MFLFWEKALGHRVTGRCTDELENALRLRCGGGRWLRFSLGDLLSVAAEGRDFSYPPKIAEVVRDSRTLAEAERHRDTYVRVLDWLRHVLLQSVRCGRLKRAEYTERSATVGRIRDSAASAVLVKQADGKFGAKGPELEEVLFEYVASQSRLYLLERLGTLRSRWVGSYVLLDGTDALKPAFARNLLTAEVFLARGTTSAAVARCTLGEYQAKQPSLSGDLFEWRVAAADGEVLVADGRLVRAIDGYIRHLRHRHHRNAGSASPDSPLFPTSLGESMPSLLPALEVLFKLAGGRPDDLEVRLHGIDILKEVMVQNCERSPQLREGPPAREDACP
jgi:hypothetical protein